MSTDENRNASKNKFKPYTPPTGQQAIDLQNSFPSLSQEWRDFEPLPNESIQERSKRFALEYEKRRKERERQIRNRNAELENMMENSRREMDGLRDEAEDAHRWNSGMTPPSNESQRHGAQTSTHDLKGAPFATPRVVPMQSMPSNPRP